jgi:hypothetical protein
MKIFLSVLIIVSITSPAYAFQWSVNEYIDNCSVVHQKTIAEEEMETVGYCMGVLKGAFSGILVTKSLETGELKIPGCISINNKNSFWEIQKNVLATMRLNYKKWDSASEPNTANAAVSFALIELYPCLLD